MGASGVSVRNQVRALIGDPNIRSVLSLQKVTRTTGSQGGYGGPTEIVNSTTSVFGVPSNFIKNRAGLEIMGDLKEGELRFLILDNVSVDTDDKVNFEGNTYHLREFKQIFFNEEVIAQSLILSKIQ